MTADPILQRRAQVKRGAELAQRIGYTLYGVAIAVFLYGVATDFSTPVSRITMVSVLAGSIVLAPAILVAYSVKAAVRDDLEHGRPID